MHYIIANEIHLKKKKNAKKLDAVLQVLQNAGKQCEVLLTNKAGDAKVHAERITSSGERHTLIAMGGDGTLHDILNGFKDFENCDLGLIPLGTGNDFAESAKIPTDVVKAAKIIASGTPSPIDFIELSSGLRSINIVGMGIDVDVLKRTYASRRKGHSKYLISFLYCLKNFKSYNFTVRYGGNEEKHRGMIVAIGNGKQFGGGIKLLPEAKINDGYLNLFMVDYISKRKILGAFIKLMRGKANKIKQAKTVLVKEAEFIHEDKDFTIQAEGELYQNIPLNAHIVAGQLKFYLPKNYD